MLRRVGYNRVVPGSVAVRQDTNAGAAVGGAIAQAGATLSGVGDLLAQVAEQKQSALNRKSLADATRQMNETANEFKIAASQEGDRKKLPNIWTKKRNELNKRLNISDASPVVREQLNESLKDYDSKMQIFLKTEDARRVADEAQASVSAAVDTHIQNGDVLLAQEEIRAAQADGVYSAQAADKAIRELDHRAERQSVNDLIDLNPSEALKSLQEKTEGGNNRNFKTIRDAERRSLMSHARASVNRKASEFISGVMLAVRRDGVSQDERLLLWESIQVQESQKQISAGQALSAYNYLFPKNNLPNWATVGKLAELVDTAPVGADEFSDEVSKIRESIFKSDAPNSEKDRLIRRLDDKIRNRDSAENSEDVREVDRFINRKLNMGFFGGDEFEEKPDDAHLKAYNYRKQARDMLRSGKSLEEVQTQILQMNTQAILRQMHSITSSTGRYSETFNENTKPAAKPKSAKPVEPGKVSPFDPEKFGL